MARDGVALFRAHRDTGLGPPPQHVLGRRRPFVADEPVELALGQPGAEVAPHVLQGDDAVQQLVAQAAVSACQAGEPVGWKLGMARTEPGQQVGEGPDVAARQPRTGRPGRAPARQKRPDPFERCFRELARRRDLAADDVEQGRPVAHRNLQSIVARGGGGIRAAALLQGAGAGEGPDDVVGPDRLLHVGQHCVDQIVDLLGVDDMLACGIVDRRVGRADHAVAILEGQHEDDAAVRVLQDQRMVAGMQARHHDVAALDQAHGGRRGEAGDRAGDLADTHTGRVDHEPGLDPFRAVAAAQGGAPQAVLRLQRGDRRARADRGAVLGGVARHQDDEAGVVDPAVRIGEAELVAALQAAAEQRLVEPDLMAARQRAVTAELVVEQQAQADQPGPAQSRRPGQDEGQRPHDVARAGEQHLPLGERFAHQAELVVLQIAQAAVDQLAARLRGARGEVVALGQQHAEAASGGIARDCGAVDAAADDKEVVAGLHGLVCRSRFGAQAARRAIAEDTPRGRKRPRPGLAVTSPSFQIVSPRDRVRTGQPVKLRPS